MTITLPHRRTLASRAGLFPVLPLDPARHVVHYENVETKACFLPHVARDPRGAKFWDSTVSSDMRQAFVRFFPQILVRFASGTTRSTANWSLALLLNPGPLPKGQGQIPT